MLQAHLSGKTLRVFTELSTAECQDNNILKKALLAAYAVVPKVYRKRFRASSKAPNETLIVNSVFKHTRRVRSRAGSAR